MWRSVFRRAVVLVGVVLASLVSAGEWQVVYPEKGGGSLPPPARTYHSMVAIGEHVYLFGGTPLEGSGQLNDLWRWQRGKGLWTPLSPPGNIPPPRYGHNAVAVDGKMYVGFGYGQTGMLDDLWRYDPQTNAWQQISVMGGPDERFLAGMASLGNGEIFLAGGYVGSASGPPDLNAYKLLLTDSMASTQHIMSMYHGNYGFVAASIGGQPMVIGGFTDVGVTNAILRWNPEPVPWGVWETVTPTGDLPIGRVLPAYAVWQQVEKGRRGDMVFLLGGEAEDKSDIPATATVQVYDTLENVWSYGPDLPWAVSSGAAAAVPSADGSTVEVVLYGGHQVDPSTGEDIPADDPRATATLIWDSGVSLVRYITATARAEGLGGTQWMTSLTAHNKGTDTATCTVSLLVRDQANPTPQQASFSVQPGQSVRYSDVLSELFFYSGGAALRLETTADLLVTSRTFNQGAEGTYGQFIPATSDASALEPGQEARLIQLSYSTDPHSGFRTNIGFVNLTDAVADVEVELSAADGTSVGTVTDQLDPYEYRQLTNIFSLAGAPDVVDGFAAVRVVTAGGRILCYASVVDNVTGDPIYVGPVADLPVNGGFIPASAHAEGLGGTVWRSDLELHNRGEENASCHLLLLPRDQANPTPQTADFTIPPGQSVRYEDVLQSLFEFTGSAAMRFEAATGHLLVSSRTYNQGAAGTYGQYIPLAPMSAVVWSHESARLIQLSRSADPHSGFRTNLGWVNATADPISIEAELFGADGTSLGTVTDEVEGNGYRQLTDIFAHVNAGEVTDGYAVVRTTTPGGGFLCYASVVDNVTGDPVYMPGM